MTAALNALVALGQRALHLPMQILGALGICAAVAVCTVHVTKSTALSTKDDQHRTGLGLAVARQVAEQHDAELSWHRKGQTTRFVVAFPAEKA